MKATTRQLVKGLGKFPKAKGLSRSSSQRADLARFHRNYRKHLGPKGYRERVKSSVLPLEVSR